MRNSSLSYDVCALSDAKGMYKNMEMTNVCPVCGKYEFADVDSHEKCPVCGWINDKFQTEHQFVGRICNRFSLAQQKKAWNLLNGEDEIGYGTDNLLWGSGNVCKLCKERVGVDECYYKVKQLIKGELPAGANDLTEARNICTKCLFSTNAELIDLKKITAMVDKPSDRSGYGNGEWGVGGYEYDIEYHQKMLKSLINYCHGEQNYIGEGYNKNPNATYAEVKDLLLPLMAEDEQGRRNFESYFARPLLSIADFIEYATDEQGNLDYRFDLWAFGSQAWEDKYEFTTEEKREAAKVLNISLSFINYKCDSFYLPGLYYLDNCYTGWDVSEFDDTIAAWFDEIGDELDEENICDFIEETLKDSFAYSHVVIALHLMSHLDFAKQNPKLQGLMKIYSKVPELENLVEKCQV